MFPSHIITAFLMLPLLTNALGNVSYASQDPALVYVPVDSWSPWAAGPCPAWPAGGQWTSAPTGSVSLHFIGVAVYVYGQWDDSSNPIYTITIDNDAPVVLGNATNPNPQSCDPLYYKTGLTLGNHEITLNLTDIRPNDTRDLSFQGFIVTGPDVGSGSGTSTAGLGGLIPTSVLASLLPTHRSDASQRYQTPLKVAGAVSAICILVTMLVPF